MTHSALLAALTLVGCDGWTFFEEAPRRPHDGKALSLKVLGTRTCGEARKDAQVAGASGLLGVEVELTSWHPGGVPANFFYASLKDSEGRAYRALSEGCEPSFEAAPLTVGQRARGYLTFPSPPGGVEAPRAMKLLYAPRLAGSGEASADARVELPLRSP
jgi:hypothetical protein